MQKAPHSGRRAGPSRCAGCYGVEVGEGVLVVSVGGFGFGFGFGLAAAAALLASADQDAFQI